MNIPEHVWTTHSDDIYYLPTGRFDADRAISLRWSTKESKQNGRAAIVSHEIVAASPAGSRKRPFNAVGLAMLIVAAANGRRDLANIFVSHHDNRCLMVTTWCGCVFFVSKH